MDQVEEIKNKLDIVQVIGEYVELKKIGSNWKANCPFHNEKTPSFIVSEEKQIFKCFGCGQGGDIFNFVQELEGLDFPEALRLLAKKAGVVLKRDDPRVYSQKNRLLDVCKLATLYWGKVLGAPQGQVARDYLKKRGVSQEMIQEFKLGYSVESWDNLSNFLKKNGFNETEIFQAGLSVKKEKGSGYYDRFRGRLIFPIQDIHGNVVGFTGRILTGNEKIAKYINTPDTMIYNKSQVLYGLDKAKREIKNKDFAVLVEGNLDVISSHQVGVVNVFACSGTALTSDHLKLIKRYSKNLALCFDMDEAGQIAAKRSIDLCLKAEMNTKIVQLLAGKDPDECIQENVDLWKKSINGSIPIMEFYFSRALDGKDLTKIEIKRDIAKDLLNEISKLNDRIEQDFWLRRLSDNLDVKETLLRETLISQIDQKPKNFTRNTPKEVRPIINKEDFKGLETLIIGFLVHFPQFLKYATKSLEVEFIREKKHSEFYKNFIIWYNKENDLTKLKKWLNSIQTYLDKSYIDSLYLFIDKEYSEFEKDDLQKEFISLIRSFKKEYYKNKTKAIQNLIAEKERQHSTEDIPELMKSLQLYISKQRDLE